MDENTSAVESVTAPAGEEPVLGERIHRLALRDEQNLLLGVIGGAVASLIGAGVWAAITVATQFQIGWMAVGVGVLVGLTLRHLGKGVDPIFGVAGAALSLFGCLLGNLLSVCGFVAAEMGISIFEVVARLNVSVATEMLIGTFSPIDLLFYAIAVYEGYKLSFRPVPGMAAPDAAA